MRSESLSPRKARRAGGTQANGESTAKSTHGARPEIQIGAAYTSQTHKVFLVARPRVSVCCMKKVTLKRRWQIGRRLRQAGKELTIARAVDYFQAALVCFDQGGFGAGLTMGFLMLVSFVLQAVRSGAAEGVL
jgi:hypothetical protein